MSKLNIKHLSFTKRPISVPAEYRPNYKIAQICLILKYACIGSKSSLLKLHLFSWAFKRAENRNTLLRFVKSDFKSDFSVWGIEPTLNRALHIATAEKYCSYLKGSYKLEEKGKLFCEKFEEDEEILSEEIALLKMVGKRKITDTKLKELANQWTLLND